MRKSSCSRCDTTNPRTAEFFFREKKSADGLAYVCKVCKTARQSAWRKNNPEAARAKDAKYNKLQREQNPNRAKEYYAANREVLRAKALEKYHSDPQAAVAYQLAWQRANPEKVKAIRERTLSKPSNHVKHVQRARNWNVENRERFNDIQRVAQKRRNERKKLNGGRFTNADKLAKFAEQNGRCFYCSVDLAPGYHTDHVVPLCKGGSNSPDNIVLACPGCNHKKATKPASAMSKTG